MDIWQLKYFIQVCNDSSFSKASRNLHISQQGLSKIIKNLEDEFEAQLFYRSPKGVILTEFGHLLFEKSQKIVEDFDSMINYLYDRSKNKKGSISIGLPHILYTNLFANLIFRFTQEYPDIKLEIDGLGSYECEKYIQEDMLDLAFTIKPVNTDKFTYIPTSSCDMMVLINKNNLLSKKSTISYEELKNQKLIMLSPEYKSRHIAVEYCLKSGFEPNIIFTASQQDLIIEMVALDKGVAILPDCCLCVEIKDSVKVSAITFNDMPHKIEMGVIISKHRKPDYITNTFIQYALKHFKNFKAN